MSEADNIPALDDPRPEPPDPENYSGCCDSGCNPCVFDLYWEAMERYEKALAAWKGRHSEDENAAKT